ncbi:MAG: BMP family protein [Roseinatronobacter sp.]
MTARIQRFSSTRRFLLLGATASAVCATAMTPARADQPLRVVGIHASPVENAWNSRIHEALTEAAAEGVIEYSFSEGVSSTDYPRVMREFAEQGVDLIVGEAYAVERDARAVADDYPDVAFLMGSSGEPHGTNFGTFGTWNHDGAYLAGMLAGAMTQTGVVGSVGAIPIPEVNLLINAFGAGVAETYPEARHLVTFIGTFFDPPRAREAGLAQIDSGADILFGERIGTADAAQQRGVLSVGSLIDYSERYPDTIFANAMWVFRAKLDAVIEDVRAGNPTGRDYTEFSLLAQGGSDISFVADMIPAEALEQMLARRDEIIAGTFVVPVNLEEPR